MNKDYVLYALPVVVFIINRIPYVGKYLRVVNTLVHESGHAIAALVTSGEVYNVELFSDTSGTAVTKTKGKFSQFLVCIIGYPFGSALAFLLFYIISIGEYRIVLYILACFSVMNLMFYVRNLYGVFWLLTFTALLFVVNFYAGEFLLYAVVVLLAGIMLFEALYSSVELLIMARKKSKTAGDAFSLERLTKVPTMIWALLFVAQSGYFIYLCVRLFFKF
ncbi:MAG: M50 family metallopeptidase [Bacteroidales bacterium]